MMSLGLTLPKSSPWRAPCGFSGGSRVRGAAQCPCDTLSTVSDEPSRPDHDTEDLVDSWVTVPDIAERYGISLSSVRQLLADRELLSLRVGERRVVAVPGRFLGPDGPLPELKGTFTVLADGGMNDEEIIRWLHTPDDTLPVPGAPIDAILAGFKTEVRRRAMEEAF